MKAFSGFAQCYSVAGKQMNLICSIIILALSGVVHSQDTSKDTVVISGTVGLEGVVMRGLPGNPVTDVNGQYRAEVKFGWAGNVSPFKEGYGFEPSKKIYSAVTSNQTNQDYSASVLSYVISGKVGATGVRMQGLPGNVVSGPDGSYTVTVDYGFSGKVAPAKEGFEFSPSFRDYSAITSNYTNQDYKATSRTYTISGTILSQKGEPMKGVGLYSISGGSVVTDENGLYYFSQGYGWSGEITPAQEGYTFTPKSRQYPDISRDQTNQNYTANIQMLTITDSVIYNNKPLQGLKLSANPGNISTFTDNNGKFSIQVPYGWTGTISSAKPGFDGSKSYKNVTTDIINGISLPANDMLEPATKQTDIIQTQISKSEGRKILIVPDENIGNEEIARTKEDINIMAEIFDERFREPRLIEGVLRDFGDFFGRDNKQTEAIYIQGYGVIFAMDVNYRFSSLSQPDEEVKTLKNSDVDQTWENARQRVLSSGNAGTQSSEGEYEKQMVNILKTELIRTLKYASNIRNIKKDEWIIISVGGTGASSATRSRNYSGSMIGGYSGSMTGGSYGGGYVNSYGGAAFSGGFEFGGYGGMSSMPGNPETVSPAASVMTIRVKRSDVDEFTNEKINFEQFRQKVQIILY